MGTGSGKAQASSGFRIREIPQARSIDVFPVVLRENGVIRRDVVVLAVELLTRRFLIDACEFRRRR